MTEEDWRACDDPMKMLNFVRPKASERKVRLFGCACCRRAWDFLTEQSIKNVVECAERFADGLADNAELHAVHEEVRRRATFGGLLKTFLTGRFREAAENAVHALSDERMSVVERVSWKVCLLVGQNEPRFKASKAPWWRFGDANNASEWEKYEQTRVFKEIFGNPFRPVTVSPSWQTANVVSLAQAIYDERAFDRMPILGDALEDAGCDNVDMLTHCRHPGEHVRGCWALDLLLGKK